MRAHQVTIRTGSGLLRLAAAASVAALLGACGQIGGVHARASARAPSGAAGGVQAQGVTQNGENSGVSRPIVGFIKIVTISHTQKGTPSGPVTITSSNRRIPDPLLVCPVQGKGYYSDDFGAPRTSGGFHPHAGNDIFAARGTPVVAPFEGEASRDANSLGGLAVIVRNSAGYVYNAHLVAYAKLGAVRAGDVIGYVGNTGDAAGGPTHDHFEWHPARLPSPPLHVSPFGYANVGTAIDPYPFLQGVC